MRTNSSAGNTDAGDVLALYQLGRVELDGRTDVTEGSYYPLLCNLLEGLASHCGAPGARSIPLPRPDEHGAPDLRVTGADGRLVGYVEVKAPGTELPLAARSPQLRRYRRGYPNLLLTDTRELRLYQHGEPVAVCHLNLGPEPAGDLLRRFFGFQTPPHRSARSLTRDLAFKARVLCSTVEVLLAGGEAPAELEHLHRALAENLIHGLTVPRFADLYAQTVAYGLLAARFWTPGDAFDRKIAYEAIPPTLGVLRDLFRYVFLEDLPPQVGWIIDDLAQTLAACDVGRLFGRYYRDGQGRDPVLHLYETFLAGYHPGRRRHRGVYYTPPELVGWVVRSVDRLLREHLGREEGLADPSVTVLDPAAGTLTFLVAVAHRALEGHAERWGDGGDRGKLKDELLDRLFAFELMPAPYTVGHLKMSLVLAQMGCPLGDGQRVRLYLTDALEKTDVQQHKLPGVAALAKEARAAHAVKFERAVTVVLGNPPWSGHSANPHRWIDESLKQGYERPDGSRDDGYYQAGGGPLGERNLKWLQDDYVKFLRFAQWKIDQAGEGIVALVTNHGYLDNPTFRGLRESLLQTFDQLYLLDLHGNVKKRRRAPDGGRDENVFGVQQGVAAALLIKGPGLPRGVFHHDLWGREKDKLAWLAGNDAATTPWRRLAPRAPGLYFVPRNGDLEDRYRRFPAVDEIFELGSVGVITGRDALVVELDSRTLAQRIGRFVSNSTPGVAESICLTLGAGDTARWRCQQAWRAARRDTLWRQRILPYLFRPFDHRYLFYADYMIERPRHRVMRHLLGGESIALVVPRQAKRHPGAFVTDRLTAHKVLGTFDPSYVFPLYRRVEEEQGNLLGAPGAVPNLRPGFLRFLVQRWGETPTPEALLGYLYAVLWSEGYQGRYGPFLATGFPRVPFPRQRSLFDRLSVLGRELVDLHLLRDRRLEHPGVRFEGEGSGRLGESREVLGDYRSRERRLYLNEQRQYLEPVAPEVWALRAGDHRVLASWLGARRGRVLAPEEVRHLCRTVAALGHTVEIRGLIEKLYARVEAES